MSNQEVKELLTKYQTGALSDQEKVALDTWYLNEFKKDKSTLTESELEDIAQQLKSKLPLKYPRSVNRRLWPQIAAAASILFICASIIYLFVYNNNENINSDNNISQNIIKPGKNKATLVLANGEKILLSSEQDGHLTNQQGVNISKTEDGKVIYTVSSIESDANTPVQHNTMVTANGEQYQLVLPDGTHVWLNAASSLTFPTQFKGNSRTVELNGEAYFEVAHNPNSPFKVLTKNQEIEVLGTHFNVNSYENESSTKTTLLEGKVKINPKGLTHPVILKPGEQAKLSANSLKIVQVDVAHCTAWKNGQFRFNGEHIGNVMRQLSRWYDIDVVFQGEVTNETFYGRVSRNMNLNEVLSVLERSKKVSFNFNGRRVIVSSKS